MKVLLDTHILIWLCSEPEQLALETLSILQDTRTQLYYSLASLWELSIKASIGRIDLNFDLFLKALKSNEIHALSIEASHILKTKDLPIYHKDPFDRLLVAQAITEKLYFFTRDQHLKQYSEKLVKLI